MLSTTQINLLGERLALASKPTPADVTLLSEFRHQFAPAMDAVLLAVQGCSSVPVGAVLTTRPEKTTGSIVAKLRRERTRLSRMRDIAGCRLVVDRRVQQEAVVDELRSRRPSWEIVDRRSDPRHGYRAVHLVATDAGRLVEVQVRTRLQQAWADLSESLERDYPGVKYGEAPQAVHDILERLSAGLWNLECADTGAGELWGDEHGFGEIIRGILRPEGPPPP